MGKSLSKLSRSTTRSKFGKKSRTRHSSVHNTPDSDNTFSIQHANPEDLKVRKRKSSNPPGSWPDDDESDGLISSGNSLHRKHPLGSRASKLSSSHGGYLTVRFEMPFPIWCASCPQPTLIPQGVRFNAQKSKTGNYHTTPIFCFTIKHTICGGTIVIQTDPKNTDYVIVSGARKRDLGGSAEDDLVLTAIRTQREKEEARETAFGKLEKTIADREQAKNASIRIEELRDENERKWEDPFTANRRLRASFRQGRHKREKEAAVAEDLKDRMGLGIDLLPEKEEDGLRAQLVDFGAVPEELENRVERVLARPLFDDSRKKVGKEKEQEKGKGKLKREIKAERMRESLVEEIRSNTRAAKDPFLVAFGGNNNNSSSSRDKEKGSALLPGLKKRKRLTEEEGEKTVTTMPPQAKDAASGLGKEEDKRQDEQQSLGPAGQHALLVSYDSDSD
ncbi:CWC16 protein [Apiosordaria backusii]|uniref:CWC16 protein n=1 Tax=Apiosordaria backusii TaxID=314023 RepID=A0AA40EN65_9PEZI|nr:CWC16 protein [Apiosordaria backusii]